MPTYRVKVRYENELGIKAVVGDVETGPGASVLGPQFLALHLDQDTRDALSDMAKRNSFNSTIPHGPVLNIAIHRIYSIEQLDEIESAPTTTWVSGASGGGGGSSVHRTWSGSDIQPAFGVDAVWDKDGHRWDFLDGVNLWESDAAQYPEPWSALLSHYGPVTDRFVA